MTDEELKELVAENSRAIRELGAESDAARAESDRRWQSFREEMRAMREESEKNADAARAESDRREQAFREEMRAMREEFEKNSDAARAESDRRWQLFQEELVASRRELNEELVASRRELNEELVASRRELNEELVASRRELDRFMQSIDRNVEELRREVGRINNKFGDYSESLCLPSLVRTLRERFRMTAIAPRYRAFHNGHEIELDLMAHANKEINEVYVAEIKTHLRQDGIEQILEHLRVFPEYFPDHRGKKLFGILAAIEAPPDVQEKAIREGLYLMLISGDVLEMRVPDDFKPRVFPTN